MQNKIIIRYGNERCSIACFLKAVLAPRLHMKSEFSRWGAYKASTDMLPLPQLQLFIFDPLAETLDLFLHVPWDELGPYTQAYFRVLLLQSKTVICCASYYVIDYNSS